MPRPFALAWSPLLARAQEVTATASSLMDNMEESRAAWAAHGQPAPRFVSAAPAVLTPLGEHEAPAGIVASADGPRALLTLLTGP